MAHFQIHTHPNNIKYPGDAAKEGLLAASVIYGPNASGKSNVLRALKAIEFLISACKKTGSILKNANI